MPAMNHADFMASGRELPIYRSAFVSVMEKLAATTGPSGLEALSTLRSSIWRLRIPSGSRWLGIYLVTAHASCDDPPDLVIDHGIEKANRIG